MKNLKSFLFFALTSLFFGTVVATFFPVNAIAASAGIATIKIVYSLTAPSLEGSIFAGVNKEIWIDKLKENFFSKYAWLDGVDDWSEWVEYNTINYTRMGANPTIVKNNSSWPITAATRTDTNATIVLDTYDSTTTRVYNVEEIEAAINKVESVVKQHRSALLQEIVTECLWNYSPATAAAGIFVATGSNRPAVIGAQTSVAARLQLSDIARAQQELDNLNAPEEGRVIVLNPYHKEDLLLQDISLNKQFADLKKGQPLPLYGFDIYTVANTPLFTKNASAAAIVKKAYGAAADNTNDIIGSTIFVQSEVMKAMGDVEMFFKPKDINPEQRADEVGFQMRFKGAVQRSTNFMQMSIVSNRA